MAEETKDLRSEIEKAFDESMEKINEGVSEQVDQKLKAELPNEVAKQVKETYMSLQDKEMTPFNGLGKEERKQLNSEVRGMLTRQLTREKASMLSTQDSAGGYTIPEEMSEEIDRISKTNGILLNLADRMNMSAPAVNIPSYSKSALKGTYIDFPTEVTDEDLKGDFGNTLLTAQTWMLVFALPLDLVQDSAVDISAFVSALAAEGRAFRIDDEGLNGTGQPFTGLRNSSATQSYTQNSGSTSGGFTPTDAAKMIANVEESQLQNAAWIVNRKDWAKIKTSETSYGALQFNTDTAAFLTFKREGGLTPAGELQGYPVYTTDLLPEGTTSGDQFIMFGDIAKALKLGVLEGMTMDRSEEATINGTSMYTSNGVGFRFKERHGLAVANAGGNAVVVGQTK